MRTNERQNFVKTDSRLSHERKSVLILWRLSFSKFKTSKPSKLSLDTSKYDLWKNYSSIFKVLLSCNIIKEVSHFNRFNSLLTSDMPTGLISIRFNGLTFIFNSF
jgi:hypothetical protein